MDTPKLSIVIATRNREYYCKRCIAVMLRYISYDTQIVISDNSDSSDLLDFVNSSCDERIFYKHSDGALTMSENFNIALECASGEYICMIGDDDIVLPSIFKYISIADEKNIDCISQKKVINYIWPIDSSNGILYLPPFSEQETIIPHQQRLRDFFKDGGCSNPRDYNLPSLYHGVIRKKTLDIAKKKYGRYINGLSPDSYLAVLLSQYISTQIEVDIPFTIGGACVGSATVSNMKGRHCGELDICEQYNMNVKHGYIWSKYIPKYYSVQTIWAESSMQAVEDKELLSCFNIERLTAIAIAGNPSIVDLILKKTAPYIKDRIKIVFYSRLLVDVSKILIRKMVNRLFPKHAHLEVIRNVGEIENVVNILNNKNLI